MAGERRGIRILRIAVSALPLALLVPRATGCTGRDAEIVQPASIDAGLLDTFVASDSTPDTSDESQPDADLDAGVSDAALSPVEFGVNPTIAAGDGGTGVEVTLAQIQTLGAGSRAGSFVVGYDALIDDSGGTDDAAFALLSATSATYAQHGASIALTLAIVDGEQDARPSALAASWTSGTATAAIEAVIDHAFASGGNSLAYLSFGYETDRFLAKASATDRAGFVALADHALDYARNHPKRPTALKVGVGFTLDALLGSGTSEQATLLGHSDLPFVSYLPLDPMFQAIEPHAAAQNLATLADASASQVVLLDVAYPSSQGAGSSPDQQRMFFDALLPTLSEHRDRFPFVAIEGLFDRDLASCTAESARYGAPSNSALLAALCSLGLMTNASTGDGGASEKPAWASVLAALSAFRSP
ncbi:MAG TPA: hypothetical protein VGI10_23390 [Polyangiaceae bacterium]|jgi:hypothetical protein